MFKEQLRLDFLSKRKELNPESISELSLFISNNLLSLPLWELQNFHIYLSLERQHEVDTTPIISILQGRDKSVIVPKITGKGSLEHFLLQDHTRFDKNLLGIPEPREGIRISPEHIDVVFVPLLAFDQKGYRVGYGGGYYDRFLCQTRTDCKFIGLSFFPPVVEITDVETHDIPLDYCITPTKVYAFTSPS